MPASDIQRKTLSFLFLAALLITILALTPSIEEQIFASISSRFNVSVSPERVITAYGEGSSKKTAAMIVKLTWTVMQVFKILILMALVIGTVRFFGQLISRMVYRNSGRGEIPSLIKTVIYVSIYIVSFFIIFQSQFPAVELAPLFTGSTIIGIVVGLALQDTLGNLFAGLALQADQPFGVGDVIIIPGRGEGVVETVSWRGVKIRTFQNKFLVVSNSVLGKEMVEVAPRNNLNAKAVYFNSSYTNSPARTAHVIREAVRYIDNVSDKIRPVARIRNLGADGMDWEVKYWMDDYTKHNDTDALIRQRIWYVFNREKIEFASPTLAVSVEPPDQQATDQTMDVVVERLNQVAIFAPLSQDETEKLASVCITRIFAPGEAIVREGQDGSSMFVITRGNVKVQVPEAGYARTIGTLSENEFFGEMSLLTGEPRSANVIATDETEVLQIKKNGLRQILESNPDLVNSISELVEERKELLLLQDDATEIVTNDKRGIVTSIKKFFGLG